MNRLTDPTLRSLITLLLMSASAFPSLAKRTGEAREAPPIDFSPPGGVFTEILRVRLVPRSGSGVIRYTLDGSAPSNTSPIASEAIVLTNSTWIKARWFDLSGSPSEVIAEAYTLVDSGLTNFSSNLPLVLINSFGEEIGRDQRVPVALRVVEGGTGRSTLSGSAHLDGAALCSLRGRSSLRYPKRSYNFKTVDASGEPLKVPLLGMPKEWDWILYAPYPDKTLMRDVLAYEMSLAMGRYATRTRLVEVFVSSSGAKLTEQDYLGVYVLEEKIKSDNFRVNITKLGPDDLTEPSVSGGYIFKKDHIDRPDPDDVNMGGFPQMVGSSSSNRFGFPTGPGGFPADPKGFLPPYTGDGTGREVSLISRSTSSSSVRTESVTNRLGVAPRRSEAALSAVRVYARSDDRLPGEVDGFRSERGTNQFYFVEPEPDELNAVQRNWLNRHVNECERALYGPEFLDASKGYRAYLDAGSFIDHHLLVEVTKNVDGFRFSTFYHKDRRDRIKMGPAWDWNLSFGNANGKQGWIPEYWLWPQLDDREYTWFRRLFEDPDFGQRYVDRFAELRRSVFATSNVLARVDELARLLEEAQARNFKRWPILGLNVNPNYYVGETYEEEIAWMKKWIAARLAWLEQQFVAAPTLSVQPAASGSERTLTLKASAGTILFTLDGSDPRAPGGAVAPTAAEYTAPVTVKRPMPITARARVDRRWSSPLNVEASRLIAER